MTKHLTKIVGMHFRPPAKAFTKGMTIGQTIMLRREPGNPYDPNAIQVLVATKAISPEDLETISTISGPMGFDEETLQAQDEWHLGFIPKEVAAELAEEFDSHGEDVVGTFGYDAAGWPTVEFDPEETFGEED